MTNVKYENMRDELIEHLRSLSDFEYQKKNWTKTFQKENSAHDEFDYAVHFFYDDTCLAKDAKSTIGVILLDESEAEKITVLIAAVDQVFNKYGLSLSDEEYISLPEWKNVIKFAKEALETIAGP